MYGNLHDIFGFNQLSTGDRLSIYNQWEPELLAHGNMAALRHLERARLHDRATQALEVRWKKRDGTGHFSPAAVVLDSRMDSVLVGVHDMAVAQKRAVPPGHEIAEAADRLLAEAFPLGVAAVVNASYVDEAAEVERIVASLRSDLAADVTRLHLDELVAELEHVGRAYRAAVDECRERLTHAEVRKAQQRGVSYLAEILVLVLARFHDSDEESHVSARTWYLDVIRSHEDRARIRRRSPRPSEDAASEPAEEASESEAATRDHRRDVQAPADFGPSEWKPEERSDEAARCPKSAQ